MKGVAMRSFVLVGLLICILGLSSGCHSGTMRGAGSDVEKMGHAMQK